MSVSRRCGRHRNALRTRGRGDRPHLSPPTPTPTPNAESQPGAAAPQPPTDGFHPQKQRTAWKVERFLQVRELAMVVNVFGIGSQIWRELTSVLYNSGLRYPKTGDPRGEAGSLRMEEAGRSQPLGSSHPSCRLGSVCGAPPSWGTDSLPDCLTG